MNLRNYLFWGLDYLKGNKISSHLKEVSYVLKNQQSNEVKKKRELYLSKLIKHANANTDFYKKIEGGANLEDFPVINKNTILDCYEEFKSDNFGKKDLKKVSTSGSTGVPLVVYHDKRKQLRQHAENIFFNGLGNFEVGDKLFYLRIWNEINKLHPLERFMKNIVPVDITNLSTEETLSLIRMLESDKSKKSILAYSSTLEAVNRNLKELGVNNVESNISCIFTMAEALNSNTRKDLRQIFGCSVLSRYSNSENGFIAHQFSDEVEEYLINTASFIVEILDFNNDEPVKSGEAGRIVVTDLFNYVMPLIRYDTGDIGTFKKKSLTGKEGMFFSKIDGRRLDFIQSAEGKRLSPHTIDYALRKLDGIDQFQFIQVGKSQYIIKLNSKNKSESLESEVHRSLKEYVGINAEISTEYVNEIPLLESGKRKIVVNEWKTL